MQDMLELQKEAHKHNEKPD